MLDLKCLVIYLAQVRHLLSLHLKILKPGVDGLPLAAARDNNSNHNNSFAFWFFIFMHLFIFLYLYFFFCLFQRKMPNNACIIISLLKGGVTVKFEKFNLAF